MLKIWSWLFLVFSVEMIEVVSSQGECYNNWRYNSETLRCYKNFYYKSSWIDARKHCLGANGDLAMISDSEVNNFLFRKMNLYKKAWMGLNDRDKEGDYIWSINGQKADYVTWDMNEPSPSGNCGTMIKLATTNRWSMDDCAEAKDFVCERPSNDEIPAENPKRCPIGWHKYQSRCFKYFAIWKTWDEAREFCISKNAKMAIVNDFGVHDIIDGSLYEDEQYWIDGKDKNILGDYNWLDSNGQPLEYTMWGFNYPQGSGRCIVLYASERSSPWVNIDCNDRADVVCEMELDEEQQTTSTTEAPTTSTEITTTSLAPPTCPDDTWKMYEPATKCIKIINSKARWQSAREGCYGLGGDLVAIPDSDTHDFIKGMMGTERYWIGLHDFELDGKWHWLNETTEIQYAAWRFPPRNIAGSEFCAELIGKIDGKWNDKRCTVKRQYICQYIPTSNGIIETTTDAIFLT